MAPGNLRSHFTHHVPKSVLDEAELRTHLQAADTTQLLLSAVHVTRDLSLLERYAGRIGTPAVFAVYASLRRTGASARSDVVESPEVRTELIDLLCSVLTKEDQPDYLGVEDGDVFSRMADAAVSTHVDDRFIPMCREQAGFVPDQRAVPPTKTPPPTLNLAIIGAGMTGLDAAIKATDRGFEYEIFEKESGTGGLWWSQTYPGVAVDTPAVYYSLSYEITPDWSKFYPQGDEYRAYLNGLAKKYELNDRLHFNSEITRMEWIDADQVWELTILDTVELTTRTVRAAAVVTAAGHLNRPKYPDIEGRETFAGQSIHTGRWRGVELQGKRAAVVGVGAAGIQVIASIADKVDHLTVFQRQAHWVSPNRLVDGGAVSDSERWLRRHLPYYLQWARFTVFWLACDVSYQMNKVDPEWVKTHPMSISPANEMGRRAGLKYINDTFSEGSELAQKLTPDFAFGGKRPVRDPGDFAPGGYYYALAQPHVDLVTTALSRVVPEGIVTADGTLHELDVIIWATGMTLDFLSPVEIIGRDGLRLSQVWADNNPRSYLGGTVPGFPNLFINDGPNTGVATGGGGHNFMTETVDHFVFECLQLLVEREGTSIEVTQEAHDAHNALIEELMLDLLWSHEHTADTYYRNQAGRIILPSPFPAEDFWNMSQLPDESKFVLRNATRVLAVTHE
jgi:4-hydroxyacetophenone monooxygenase